MIDGLDNFDIFWLFCWSICLFNLFIFSRL